MSSRLRPFAQSRALPALALCSAFSALGLASAIAAAGASSSPSSALDFARDVRPILSDKCFACHGPDAAAREAELRLDVRAEALRDRGGYAAIVPGEREASELWLRLHAERDPMPPIRAEKTLSAAEREILGRWIDEGAHYSEHWSFVPPTRPALPAVAGEAWVRSPIDRFVLARLEEEGLAPSPPAERAALLRRVTLDLTGLPPTPVELQAFLEDDAPDAYERVVARLFESPHHAEALTRRWLDAARYADTHGFHIDNERALYRWRDWVIDAFAANKPFDEFVLEQLAGDLVEGEEGEGPTLEQRIATGFNRCNPTTGEGGLIDDEWLVRYAADRVETTATIFLGLTLQCAQCHDHKFEPVSQEDYYRFFAFFHNLAEEGTDRNALAPPPAIRAPYPEQRGRLEALETRIATQEQALQEDDPELDAAQLAWEETLRARVAARWTTLLPTQLAAENGTLLTSEEDGTVLASGPQPDVESYLVEAVLPSERLTGLRLEALLDPEEPTRGVGRASHGNIVLSELGLEVAPTEASAGDAAAWVPAELALAEADHSQQDFDVGRALDGDPGTGWALAPLATRPHTARFVSTKPFGFTGGTRLRVRLAFESRFTQHALGRFRLSASTEPELLASEFGPWERTPAYAAASFDEAFERTHGPELRLRAEETSEPTEPTEIVPWEVVADAPPDGQPLRLQGANSATYLRRTIVAPTARSLNTSLGSDDAVKVWLNGELVHAKRALRPWAPDQDRVALPLVAGENELVVKVVNAGGGYAFSLRRLGESPDGLPLDVAAALASAPAGREDSQRELLRAFFRRENSEAFRAGEAELVRLRDELVVLERDVPMSMVSEERAERRPTYFLERGNYALRRHEVQPGTPAFLPPLERRERGRVSTEDAPPADRLDLARWLVSDTHPLTARVSVNRFWQALFGSGLVETSGDFGSQGAFPSHPELLDWLAVEFREGGWDVRALLELLVTSATYRQASAVTSALLARDPDNRLLARGPSHRLDGEEIRDAALAVSGLLVRDVGGPSVKPYQPDGLWSAVSYPSSNTARFQRDEGGSLYRRSMYTFWKRTSPPPAMALFDAPNRESCTVRRSRTNTPLQALALLNEEGFVEAARALAERVLREVDAAESSRDAALARRAFRLVLTRAPDEGELAILLDVLTSARADAAEDPDQARALLAIGARAVQDDLEPLEVAAWTQVTNLLLNLDEFVTKR